MCSKNTVRESAHIYSFSGGDTFSEVVGRPENTHGEQTGYLEWPAGISHSLRDQRISTARLNDERIPSSPKLQTLYCLSSPMRKYKHPLRLTLFSIYGLFWNLYTSIFPVICWSYQRTEIYVILSTCNKLPFSFSWETSLLMLSCDRIESTKFIVPS